jgi:heptosyltransferase III
LQRSAAQADALDFGYGELPLTPLGLGTYMNIDRAEVKAARTARPQLMRLSYVALVQLLRLCAALIHPDARHLRRLALRDALKSLRRELRQVFGHGLRLLVKRDGSCAPLERAEIRSVLICRLNARLGNTLLLTPLIKHIHESLPDAAIDVATAYPKAANLLQDVPGIRHVIVYPYKSANAVWRYLVALRRMRAQRYDLAIDPTPDSTSARVAIALARARYRLGFDTFSQWVRLTHAVALPAESMHDAVRPAFLFCEALRVPLDASAVRLWLPLLKHEVIAGRTAVAEVLQAAGAAGSASHVFGFFASAAGHKTIDRAWWREFWRAFRALEPEAMPLEFLSLAHGECVDPRFPALSIKSPRSFAAAIAATRMFIAPDTGPMHLASSTSVATIGLFRGSDTARYRPLKPHDLMINVTENSASRIAERCQRIWRQQEGAESAASATGAQVPSRVTDRALRAPVSGKFPGAPSAAAPLTEPAARRN